MRIAALAVVAASTTGTLLASEAVAHAGLDDFGWIFDTATLPERGVELEQWVSDQHRQGAAHEYDTSIWWGPVIGVTDQLELAVPIEWEWTKDDFSPARTTLAHFGAELRWRLVSADPVDAPAVVPLIRVAVKRPIYEAEAAEVEADAVVSYTSGIVHATADLGGYAILQRGTNLWATHSGAGVSVEVNDDLRVGAEAYGEYDLAGGTGDDTWVIVGPDLAWTHGRFWLTATFGVGIYQITSAPRIKWGVAF